MIKDSFKYGFILKVLKISIHHFFENYWFKKLLIFQKCWFRYAHYIGQRVREMYLRHRCTLGILVERQSIGANRPLKNQHKVRVFDKVSFLIFVSCWDLFVFVWNSYVIDWKNVTDYYVTKHYISYEIRFRSKIYHNITVTKYYVTVRLFWCYVIFVT